MPRHRTHQWRRRGPGAWPWWRTSRQVASRAREGTRCDRSCGAGTTSWVLAPSTQARQITGEFKDGSNTEVN